MKRGRIKAWTERCVLIDGIGWAHVLDSGQHVEVAVLGNVGFGLAMRAADIVGGQHAGRILATAKPKPGRSLFGERRP